jgi:hypothetical protein
MTHIFHYYSVYYLATEAGFSSADARTIAYSSQFLDDALVSYSVKTERGSYQTLSTHHFGFWDRAQEANVWIPFHFIPGDRDYAGAPRIDEEENPYNVTPHSSSAKTVLIDALKSRNLYRVGIALHSYADTFAHQNFSGKNEAWNRLSERSPMPPIGHAQAGHKPDGSEGEWEDPRLKPGFQRVNNRVRLRRAARLTYKYLATFNGRSFDDADWVIERLEQLLGGEGEAKGEEQQKIDFIIECEMEEYRRNDWKAAALHLNEDTGDENIGGTEDKLLWLKNELFSRARPDLIRPITARPGFYDSHYYHWNQAAREHRGVVKRTLPHLF